MTTCAILEAGTIELYFYGELPLREAARFEEHVRGCRECSAALDELDVIRAALASRSAVSSPSSGDWSAFMERLDAAVRAEDRQTLSGSVVTLQRPPALPGRRYVGLLATAALLAIVSLSVFVASQAGRRALETQPGVEVEPAQLAAAEPDESRAIPSGLASVSARHLERSKLVVLGIASKEPATDRASDWAYERTLATSLLNDTRLYRLAAEQRGLTSLAGVMRDLELVLLQTSMADGTGESELPQIQRLIRTRGLVQKMDVSDTTGLVP
jgi:hypothetical protein